MMKTLTIKARVDRLNEMTAFAEQFLEEIGCPLKIGMQIVLAVEELFVNVANYAYPDAEGDVRLDFESPDEDTVLIRITDSGISYDPTTKEDPDISLSFKERGIGGLGIFMVKKLMDSIWYERQDEKNILEIKKSWKE